ncbi:Hypothetical_protein [Hexamita inflata]|uniref:Hypothetical_protein n=1 Tax=Hexamita inflata TaxID=28002 RepID=A0AA86RLR3_9EUKA|nr:Hypothetical protein HINF_LOCUS62004 [Hexamita inflata]
MIISAISWNWEQLGLNSKTIFQLISLVQIILRKSIYYKNFIQLQNSAICVKQSQTKLEQCQLMHVFKPLPQYDLYMVIEDNYLYVIDQESNILSKSQIACELYSGFETMCPQLGQIYHYYNYQMIPCNGVLYIQIHQSVYKLQNAYVDRVFQCTQQIRR